MSRVPFLFSHDVDATTDEFVAVLPAGISGSAVLLTALARALRFPDYFGGNWNGLSDCLRDLHWLTRRSVILQHVDVPSLTPVDLLTYLDVLADAVESWRPNESHVLRIVFPESAELVIRRAWRARTQSSKSVAMPKMNSAFMSRWEAERLDEGLTRVVLHPRLRALVHAPFVRQSGGGLFLEPLTRNVSGSASFEDTTAYEAFVNKFHVDDMFADAGLSGRELLRVLLEQGTKAAIELAARLASEGGAYRVMLTLEPELPSMTLRFFGRRGGKSWGSDDPDAYMHEEVLQIDAGHGSVPAT